MELVIRSQKSDPALQKRMASIISDISRIAPAGACEPLSVCPTSRHVFIQKIALPSNQN
jgi:hypothetical protein